MRSYRLSIAGPRRDLSGYILLEAIVSMAILSAGMIAVHGGMQQTLSMRGQARDYTQARFLIENLIAELDLQPQHVAGSKSGRFAGEFARFSYQWEISRTNLPTPPTPANTKPEDIKKLTYAYIAHVRVTLNWKRNSIQFSESAETLLTPNRLFVPPEKLERPAGLVF